METETPDEQPEVVIEDAAKPKDAAPSDPIIWVRGQDRKDLSWHIVDEYLMSRVPGVKVLDGDEYHWPEYRADLGAEKSCEVCMRIYMQKGDL